MKKLSRALYSFAIGFSLAFLMLAGVILFNFFKLYGLIQASIILALYIFCVLFLYYIKHK
jgi:hypothetical protein